MGIVNYYIEIVVSYWGLIYKAEIDEKDLPEIRKVLRKYEKKVFKEDKESFIDENEIGGDEK